MLVIRKILVIRPNHRLGNLVLLTPFIRDLRRAFPGAKIDLVVGGGVAHKIFQGYPDVEIRYIFPSRSFRMPGAVLRTMLAMRRTRYDLAVDPNPKSASGRFLLRWVDAQRKLGYRWHRWLRDRCLTHRAERPRVVEHFSLEPGRLLREAQPPLWPPGQVQASGLDVVPSSAERDKGRRIVLTALAADNGAGPIIGLYALATAAKNYAPEWWARVAAHLRSEIPQARLVEILAHDGIARVPTPLPGIHSTELRELGGILASLNLFVTGDCGVMHLAAASGVPVAAAFKATDARRYGPLGPQHLSVDARDDAPEGFAAQVVQHFRSLPRDPAP
jgi:heptosyltransferase III